MLQNYSAWITGFIFSLEILDGIKTAEHLSNDVQYYETPDGKPCVSWEYIFELWTTVPNNRMNISYSFEIVWRCTVIGRI